MTEHPDDEGDAPPLPSPAAPEEPGAPSDLAALGVEGAVDWEQACKHLLGALSMHEQVIDALAARVTALEQRLG